MRLNHSIKKKMYNTLPLLSSPPLSFLVDFSLMSQDPRTALQTLSWENSRGRQPTFHLKIERVVDGNSSYCGCYLCKCYTLSSCYFFLSLFVWGEGGSWRFSYLSHALFSHSLMSYEILFFLNFIYQDYNRYHYFYYLIYSSLPLFGHFLKMCLWNNNGNIYLKIKMYFT